jgi:uncharacterized Tic20 family protein
MPDRKPSKSAAEPLSRDPQLLSAIAHASILAVFLMGPLTLIVPLVIWLTERNRPGRSEEIEFHGRQAFFFQAFVYLSCFVAGALTALLTLIFIGLLFIPFLIVFFLGAVVYGVYGAMQVWQGRPFRYRYLTDFIEKDGPAGPSRK